MKLKKKLMVCCLLVFGVPGGILGYWKDQDSIYQLLLRDLNTGVASPAELAKKHNFDPEDPSVRTIFILYGLYDDKYILEAGAEQIELDIHLIQAVLRQDVKEVKRLLFAGANPNTGIVTQTQFELALSVLGKDFPERKTELPLNGLLSDALRMEMSAPRASISRLLLLFGASVRPCCRVDQGSIAGSTGEGGEMPHLPVEWIQGIRDRDLAIVIDYYDPLNERDNVEATRIPFSDDELRKFEKLEEYEKRWWSDLNIKDWRWANSLESLLDSQKLQANGDSNSSICNCLGLSSVDPVEDESNKFCIAMTKPSFGLSILELNDMCDVESFRLQSHQ